MILVNVTGQEGATYDYMDRFMQDLSQLITDSIPEKKISLIVTSPGFSAGSLNRGFARLSLVDPEERDASQKDVANRLTKLRSSQNETKNLFLRVIFTLWKTVGQSMQLI